MVADKVRWCPRDGGLQDEKVSLSLWLASWDGVPGMVAGKVRRSPVTTRRWPRLAATASGHGRRPRTIVEMIACDILE